MSEPNVSGIAELADPENHTIEPKITTLSYINVKKLQFNQVLTATCIEWHIENSKNDKKVILAIIISPKRQCDAE